MSRIFIFFFFFPITVFAQVTVPNTFTDGTPALAGEVNENFEALADEIVANFIYSNINKVRIDDAEQALADYQKYINSRTLTHVTIYSQSDFNEEFPFISQVQSATCPAGSVLTGGSIGCFSEGEGSYDNNIGFVASSLGAGNAYSGYCLSQLPYDENKMGPAITAVAICATIVDTSTSSLQALTIDGLKSNSSETDGSNAPLNEQAKAGVKRLQIQRNKIIQAYSGE
jgi:hypothetical protein